MATPTQQAELAFTRAKSRFQTTAAEAYGQGTIPGEMREGLEQLCDGLKHLSQGVRAIYMLIEERERRRDQQEVMGMFRQVNR